MSCFATKSNALGEALAFLQSLGDGLEPPESWASAQVIDATAIPDPQCRLLVHDRHMTATLNNHYGQHAALRVLEVRRENGVYRRKILLTIDGGAKVVEYGLMRLNLVELPEPARHDVLSETLPLGEILARYDLLTRVDSRHYLRFPETSPIVDYFDQKQRVEAYGRLAMIYCNGRPAVELLEVVSA